MKICKLLLENFLCYYGKKEFIFEDGLNLILGRNGEGKTKFFESIEWLFSAEKKDNISLASSKAIKDLENVSKFHVGVTLVIEKNGEISLIEKSFDVYRKEESLLTSNFKYVVLKDNENGDRIPLDGVKVLPQLFPDHIRRYSMFKGESQLNIFDNEDALKDLIDAFSEVKHYPIFIEKSDIFRRWYQEAMDRATRTNATIGDKMNKIQDKIVEIRGREFDMKNNIKETEAEIDKAKQSLNKIEQNSTKSELIKTLNERIERKKDTIRSTTQRIKDDYTTYLLDEKWVLLDFNEIFNEFTKKIQDFRKVKNIQERQYYKEIAKEKAELELTGGVAPLPWFIPNEGTMQECIDEKICKVCNTPAPENSEALKFMQARLDDYLEHKRREANPDNDEDEKLFLFDYVEKLQQLAIALESNDLDVEKIKDKIRDWQEFNRTQKDLLLNLKIELDSDIEDKSRIMADSTVSESDLLNMFSNIKGWTNSISTNTRLLVEYQNKLTTIQAELAEEEEKKNRTAAQVLPGYQMNTFNILKDINAVFINTKERLLNEFIKTLEEKSNQFIAKINVDDFTGKIKLRRIKDKIEVQLLNIDGSILNWPNGSLEISKHIAILFAISELASETEEESFPMLFDAPTSSFDPAKVQDFYNLLYNTKKQRIITTKDFTTMTEERTPIVDAKNFEYVKRDKAYWICRERPFSKEDLSTIETNVEVYEQFI